MSISTIQEKLFNKGCGSALVVIAAVAMGVSMFTSQCSRVDRMNGPSGENNPVVANVDGIPINAQGIQAEAATIQERGGGGQSPIAQATALAIATRNAVNRAATLALATKQSITLADVEKITPQLISEALDSEKMKMLQQGQLKGFGDADFEKAYPAAHGGKTIAQFRKEVPENLKSQFNDPNSKGAVLESLAPAILASRYGEKAVGSDQELRDSYKTFVVKRLFFSAQSGSKDTPEARAAKAEAALKSGTSFDKLMDSVSNDPPLLNKPVHEKTESLPPSEFNSRPELYALKGKAIGATTAVVDVPDGKAIYRLDAIRDDAPPDFDTNKAKYRAQKAQTAGQAELDKAVRDLVAKSATWESQGFHALAVAADVQGNRGDVTKAIELAQAASKSENQTEKRLGVFAMLIATLPPPDATPDPAKSAPRLAALEAALSLGLEDPAISLELADLYGASKDGAKAAAALVAASKGNQRYDTEGERTFRDVATKVRKLTDAKVLNADQIKEIEAQQALWRAGRTDSAKAVATGEKANEAEIARQKAEAAKSAGGTTTTVRPATDAEKANAAEIARQKAEAAKGKGK